MRLDIEAIVIWALVAICLALVSFSGWLVYADEHSEKIELTKSEWVCTHQETRTHYQPTTIGKTTILMPITSTICTTYTRSAK